MRVALKRRLNKFAYLFFILNNSATLSTIFKLSPSLRRAKIVHKRVGYSGGYVENSFEIFGMQIEKHHFMQVLMALEMNFFPKKSVEIEEKLVATNVHRKLSFFITEYIFTSL